MTITPLQASVWLVCIFWGGMWEQADMIQAMVMLIQCSEHSIALWTPGLQETQSLTCEHTDLLADAEDSSKPCERRPCILFVRYDIVFYMFCL